MSTQAYSVPASRNLIRAAMGYLERAEPVIVFGDFGDQKEMPENSTDTLVFRRILPFGAVLTGSGIGNPAAQYVGTPQITAANFVASEGVTPNANTVSFQDVSVTLQNFVVLYKFSSKVERLYEDDIPTEMQKLVGETLGEVLELVRFGVNKAGTQIVYANGSTRAAVNSPVSLNKLRQVSRVLQSNRAKLVTTKLASGVDFGSVPVPASFIVFMHTDCANDVRNLPNFKPYENYASGAKLHAREIGAVDEFRFITSPLFSSFAASGSTTLNGMASIAGVNVDVYPYIIIGESAWGQVALKGMNAITPTMLSSKLINHANPSGMFGYVGGNTWFNAVRLNEAWMLRLECGVTAL